MTLSEIKAALAAGKRVFHGSTNYEVKATPGGAFPYVITCLSNGYTTALTWRDGVTMNGEPHEFFVEGER